MTDTIDGLLTRANYPDRLLDKLCLIRRQAKRLIRTWGH
jgi:hypothetical protein